MKLFAAALALTCFMVGQARATEDEEPAPFLLRVLGCGEHPALGEIVCLVRPQDLAEIVKRNNENYDRARKAEAEATKLREIKGCARVDVVPKKLPKCEARS